MASYDDHEVHGCISLGLNLILITFLVIIVYSAHDRTKSSWVSKKKLMFYVLLLIYGLGSAISLLLLFYHQHEDAHFGGDPLIQSVIFVYFGSYIETILFYMAKIDKKYCFCAHICFGKKYSFIIMPIFVLVTTGLLVGIYAATQTKAAFFVSFLVFLGLTFYSIVHLFIMIQWHQSINPYYIVHISMISVIIVFVGPLLAALDLCEDCLLIFFVYGTNILSILALVFIYNEEIEELLKKLSKRRPLVAAGDVHDDDKLEFEKNEIQKNVKIIEEEDDESKDNVDKSEISLEGDDIKSKKDQTEKPQVNIEPIEN